MVRSPANQSSHYSWARMRWDTPSPSARARTSTSPRKIPAKSGHVCGHLECSAACGGFVSSFGFGSPVGCYSENKRNFSVWGASLSRTRFCFWAGLWRWLSRACWPLLGSALGLWVRRQSLTTCHCVLTFVAVIVILTRMWQIFMYGARSLSNSVLVQYLHFYAVVVGYCCGKKVSYELMTLKQSLIKEL